MNSCTSTFESACAPPLSTFSIGTGQHVRVRAADVAVEREPVLVGDGLGRGERDAEQRVGAEARLVVGAVEGDEHPVEAPLVGGVEADDRVPDLAR